MESLQLGTWQTFIAFIGSIIIKFGWYIIQIVVLEKRREISELVPIVFFSLDLS
jgi:DNA modification methylase